MRKLKKGFTLVEIALFLAVTSLLFVGIIAGTQNSMWQQRYNDSVQSFANFIRNVYSEVSNPQSLGDGRSDLAIYGRLITFGQEVELDGTAIDAEQKAFVYDVVGSAYSMVGTGDVISMLMGLNANVTITETYDDGSKQVMPAGIVDTYIPIWSASIESAQSVSGVPELFKGSILIVKHPKSGTINTLYSEDVINVNAKISEVNESKNYVQIENLLVDYLGSFELKDVDFCMNPYGFGNTGTLIRDIRITRNARNSSGVEIIGLGDSGSNGDRCRKE